MAEVLSVTPHIPSSKPQVTRDFFVKLLGFNVGLEKPEYIELKNGNFLIGIQKALKEPNQQSIYIEVRGIDALWDANREELSRYKHRELFIQDYGMKEFHIVAPNTRTLIFVGEACASEEDSR